MFDLQAVGVLPIWRRGVADCRMDVSQADGPLFSVRRYLSVDGQSPVVFLRADKCGR